MILKLRLAIRLASVVPSSSILYLSIFIVENSIEAQLSQTSHSNLKNLIFTFSHSKILVPGVVNFSHTDH